MSNDGSLPKWKLSGRWAYPIQSGHTFTPARGFITTAIFGGKPNIRKNYDNQPTEVVVSYQLKNSYEIYTFFAFWYGVIGMGSKKFIARLFNDGAEGSYVCQMIAPPSFSEFKGWRATISWTMMVVPADTNE